MQYLTRLAERDVGGFLSGLVNIVIGIVLEGESCMSQSATSSSWVRCISEFCLF